MSADALSDDAVAVVESRYMLEELAGAGELVGRRIAGVAAPSVSLAGCDLDGVTVERSDLRGADLSGVRLERGRMSAVDGRGARARGALWHRISARDCDFTEIDLEGAEVNACELGPLVMPRARLVRARLSRTRFLAAELAGADFSAAVLCRCVFIGYGNSPASLGRVSFRGAALVEVDLAGANLYGADLSGALLVRCDLRDVNLCSGDLTGARLVGCRTAGADVDDAVL